MKKTSMLLGVLLVMLVAACATRPAGVTSDPDLALFLRTVERSLERHDWAQIIAMADRNHYQTQVLEHGMSEPQYIAELFGLHSIDNNIRTGDRVSWSDLQRIDSIQLDAVDDGRLRHLRGSVMLQDGERLELNAMIEESDRGYVLTAGFG